jgi:hypothetical protein
LPLPSYLFAEKIIRRYNLRDYLFRKYFGDYLMLSEIKNNGLLAELKRVEKRVEELEKSESILREEKASLENLIKKC